METLKSRSSLHGYVMFMFLATVTKDGICTVPLRAVIWSACEAPSSPVCFRKNAGESVYTCEWSMDTTESDVTFDLYFNETKFKKIMKTRYQINEEQLIKYRPVHIWVEAHVGNSSCTSPRRTVVLGHIVKYEAPQNISVSWLRNNLSLTWKAAEKHPALAEVKFRRDGHPNESWEKLIKTTNENSQVIVVNLLNDSAYQVQIRHQSTQAQNPLWSEWSPLVIVPAELKRKPEVNMKTKLLNGTREVKLIWKPMPHATAVRGVTYSLEDTQSSQECPCAKRGHEINTNTYTIYVSYSAVNISVIARNAAGYSPSAIIQVPVEPAANLQPCGKMSLNEKIKRRTCKQWYEFQDSGPENVITLSSLKDHVRYLYFEHKCNAGKPRTVQMCLFYKEEGAPTREPQDFNAFSETHNSTNLSWKPIPLVDQQGFLTNYSLCIVKISSQHEQKECRNISASLIKYRLENLTPGAKYSISLAAVTRGGEGPQATVTINTLQEKPGNVWWSFGLLVLFFLSSTMCTVVLKRIQSKIFPSVPIPVIPDFTSHQQQSQEMLEEKEEVHELTLLQLHPEGKSVPEDAGETTAPQGEWDHGSDEDEENERGDSRLLGGTDDESPGSTDQALRSSRDQETDLEQVENEIAMLIYRNGLVFDLKPESPYNE